MKDEFVRRIGPLDIARCRPAIDHGKNAFIGASAGHVSHVIPGMLENPEPPLNELLEVVRRAILEAGELKDLADQLAKARESVAKLTPPPVPPVNEAEEGASERFLNQSEPLPEKVRRR